MVCTGPGIYTLNGVSLAIYGHIYIYIYIYMDLPRGSKCSSFLAGTSRCQKRNCIRDSGYVPRLVLDSPGYIGSLALSKLCRRRWPPG